MVSCCSCLPSVGRMVADGPSVALLLLVVLLVVVVVVVVVVAAAAVVAAAPRRCRYKCVLRLGEISCWHRVFLAVEVVTWWVACVVRAFHTSWSSLVVPPSPSALRAPNVN